ncbi:hypothetical protein XELAEV_18002811mg [Xenopus laevis]|nr:hypothetical protein XELAEV_18002811mg [Xenopus laevis]
MGLWVMEALQNPVARGRERILLQASPANTAAAYPCNMALPLAPSLKWLWWDSGCCSTNLCRSCCCFRI